MKSIKNTASVETITEWLRGLFARTKSIFLYALITFSCEFSPIAWHITTASGLQVLCSVKIRASRENNNPGP
ncbi:hypothetical protein [Oleiagrimonas soli]|uniref:Uncharacterized protein n=1 Tax=Oleiagrimonas soli TaxID=1543381 RepID=A0A841KLD1_9GAMM|nr:hypothetical protein [Oleiagrimonas soli]MBB6183471.1 hypothetical protein [Oleiagrimonas soli]